MPAAPSSSVPGPVGPSTPEQLARLQRALDEVDAPALAAVLREAPALARTTEALWRHPKGDRRKAPVLWLAACHKDSLPLTRALIECGADPNAPAVYHASDLELMRYLLDHGMDPDAMIWPENCTGLMYAAFMGTVSHATLLLERRADPNVALPNCGSRAAHWLAWRPLGNEDDRVAVLRLLVADGADVNARTFSGLDDAPITDDGNLYLVEHGGATPLHLVAAAGAAKLVAALLDAEQTPPSGRSAGS